jgi:hypothetical protein
MTTDTASRSSTLNPHQTALGGSAKAQRTVNCEVEERINSSRLNGMVIILQQINERRNGDPNCAMMLCLM